MPTSNSAWSLHEVLASILNFDYDLKRMRLVFVDNCSSDDTIGILNDFAKDHGGQFESIKIERKVANIPVARNICFDLASDSDYVFILDSDVIAPTDTIVTLLNDFKILENVGMASFPWDHTNAKARARSLYNAFEPTNVQASAYKVGNGCNMLSMKAFRIVGYFNPKLNVHEDGEYCYRLKKNGFNIICDFSREGSHLKRVPTPARFYLKFIWSSSNTYIEMLKLGSLMHVVKFATTIVLISSLALFLGIHQVVSIYVFFGALIISFWVNTSRRVLDDGIHVKPKYLPVIAPIFTALTGMVVLASLGRMIFRGLSKPFKRKNNELEHRLPISS